MYQYLITCSATNENDQWTLFSIAVSLESPLKTLNNVYEVQPIVQKIAEQYFQISYKSFFILMFHELEEEVNDRSTETDTTE
jgi:hypothetical protein